MKSRRTQTRPAPRQGPNLTLLEVGPQRTRPLRLRLGHSVIISDGVNWEVGIVAREDGTVEVRASDGAVVRVNDVQLRNSGRARAGDLIVLPDRALLVQHFSAREPAGNAVYSHEAFEQRFIEEVSRIAPTRGSLAVLVVRSRALLGEGLAEFLSTPLFSTERERTRPVIIGRPAPTALELLFPGVAAIEADAIREQLSETLGRLGSPFRWGWASAPFDGLHPATLWGRALDRLFGDQPELAEELPHADPVMVRLWSLCDIWAGMKGGVLLHAEEGSGRETLARVIHERATPHSPFVVLKSGAIDSSSWQTNVDRAIGGSLYVRHLECLPSAEHASFWQAKAFRPMAAARAHDAPVPQIVIAIPALRDRVLDILPIAEHVLARCSGLNGSRNLKLSQPARSFLSKEWTGSVRELKTSLQLAALLVESSGDVLPEHIARGLSEPQTARLRETDLRALLLRVERRSYLEALCKTNWNVTEAARLLNLPRRTLIYRLSRLGIKRAGSDQ
jgi:Bacterial regulatory protein, Fis family